VPTTLIRVLVPGTSQRFRCGGLSVELQTARLVSSLCETELVTYRERHQDHPFLDDLLNGESPQRQVLWIVSWGFDVPALVRRLRGHRVAYHAHSSGYGFTLPPGVPVLAVSRNTLGYWGDRCPRNPLLLVPNAIEPAWLERGARGSAERRPIDVLVQARKSSRYVLEQLVPALRQRGLRVEVQSGWVDDLVDLFNRSCVYLYDSAEYWRGRGVTEGFGLPPLEALACGCVVFSSLNHALADHGDPGRMVHQIGCGRLTFDLRRVEDAVRDPAGWRPPAAALNALLDGSSEASLLQRWTVALDQLDALDDAEGPLLSSSPTWQLRLQQLSARLRRVVDRLPGWPSTR
jgi:hypothetical protein|tara:strand:- start:607 stop:1647 length:1041 start_codon:yes stop_codon:yes gene_type:complete